MRERSSPALRCRVPHTDGTETDRLERYAGIIVLFMLASSLVTYLLSSLLQRIISRPILELAATARTVSADKNYAVRARKRAIA